jgi:hypothetical protein
MLKPPALLSAQRKYMPPPYLKNVSAEAQRNGLAMMRPFCLTIPTRAGITKKTPGTWETICWSSQF